MDDPNINPIYDALLGHDTTSGVFRMMGLIVTFMLVGGTCFHLLY